MGSTVGGGDLVLILGIETATDRVGVALGDRDSVVALVEIDRGRRHAEMLMPAVEFACREADVGLAEIGAVAVDVGPGLFTGMRVGIATAKALSRVLRVPTVGVGSLELLAHPMRDDDRLVASVMDARKGELFYRFFRFDDASSPARPVSEARCASVDELEADLRERGVDAVCVGDGARLHLERLSTVPRCTVAAASMAHPSAASVVEIARRRANREQWVEPGALAAEYLRLPDAQINWSTRESPNTNTNPNTSQNTYTGGGPTKDPT